MTRTGQIQFTELIPERTFWTNHNKKSYHEVKRDSVKSFRRQHFTTFHWCLFHFRLSAASSEMSTFRKVYSFIVPQHMGTHLLRMIISEVAHSKRFSRWKWLFFLSKTQRSRFFKRNFAKAFWKRPSEFLRGPSIRFQSTFFLKS